MSTRVSQSMTFNKYLNEMEKTVQALGTKGKNLTPDEIKRLNELGTYSEQMKTLSSLGYAITCVTGLLTLRSISGAVQGGFFKSIASTMGVLFFGVLTLDLYRLSQCASLIGRASMELSEGLEECDPTKATTIKQGVSRVFKQFNAKNNETTMVLNARSAEKIQEVLSQIKDHYYEIKLLTSLDTDETFTTPQEKEGFSAAAKNLKEEVKKRSK